MPSSTSTNAPNSVRLRTLPLIFEPIGYFSASCSQGFALDLLQAEADAVRLLVDAEHLALDLLAHGQELRGVLDLLGPGHLGDVDEPLDALLELDERAVVGEAHDLALDARAHRVLDGGGRPGVGLAAA